MLPTQPENLEPEAIEPHRLREVEQHGFALAAVGVEPGRQSDNHPPRLRSEIMPLR